MKSKNIQKNLKLIIFLLILCVSCAKKPESIEALISASYETTPGVSATNAVDIILTNNSKYCIVFPLLDGLKIFVNQGGNVISVNNLVDIVGSQDFILPPKGEPLATRAVYLRPDISSLTVFDSTQFTAQFTGYLCDDKDFQITKNVIFTIPTQP